MIGHRVGIVVLNFSDFVIIEDTSYTACAKAHDLYERSLLMNQKDRVLYGKERKSSISQGFF